MEETRAIWEGAPISPTNWPVALFGHEIGLARAEDWCDAAGFRAARCGWDAARQPLDCALRLVAAGSDDVHLGPLLAALHDQSADGTPLVIAASLDLVDLCSAMAPSASLLVNPSRADAVGTMLLVAQRGGHLVHDLNPERDAAQLRKLTEDVERIARVLASLSAEDAPSGLEPGIMSADEDDVAPIDPPVAVGLIRRILRARRLRDRYFSAELFSDPAWDMLLDLTAARIDRKRVAVSSLCIAAAVPPTTALRHIRSLTDAGIFVRRPDLLDGRRVFIELSDRAGAAMMAYLGRVAGDFVAATA